MTLLLLLWLLGSVPVSLLLGRYLRGVVERHYPEVEE